MFWVYVIRNKEKGKIYIGQTIDLENRLKRHNRVLKTKRYSFTSINKGNWEIVYKGECGTRKEALVREKYLKSHQGRNWLRTHLGR